MINALTPNASEGILHSECWLHIQIDPFTTIDCRLFTFTAYIKGRIHLNTRARQEVLPSHTIHIETTSNKAVNMKVLVTGGSGFIAAHCIDQLLAHGFVNWSRNP